MVDAYLLIVSTETTSGVAEHLQRLLGNALDSTVWTETQRQLTTGPVVDICRSMVGDPDFVILLAAKDCDGAPESPKQECEAAFFDSLFDAGQFVAMLGKERCMFASDVPEDALPSTLRNSVTSIHLNMDGRWHDESLCISVANKLADAILTKARDLPSRYGSTQLPVLTFAEVFDRERLYYEGGDLYEGTVLVCDTQTHPNIEYPRQVFQNIQNGISYLYFLFFTEDSLARLVQGLHVLASGMVTDGNLALDFQQRNNAVLQNKERVLRGLRAICEQGRLTVSFLPTEPAFQFRVHNATDPEKACIFLRHKNRGFLLWDQGERGAKLYDDLPKWIKLDRVRFFQPLTHYHFSGEERLRFIRSLDEEVRRYFSGIEKEIMELCLGEGET